MTGARIDFVKPARAKPARAKSARAKPVGVKPVGVKPDRASEAGFTLIEALVALAILALSAVTLLGATEAHIARIGALETRAAAEWVVQNYLAELTLGTAANSQPDPMLGRRFRIAELRTATVEPSLQRVDLKAVGEDGHSFARLTGFLDLGLTEGAQP